MRKAVRTVLVGAALLLFGAAARAQAPAADGDARCRMAVNSYVAAVSDKAHRTVEEQTRVEYVEGKKYLRACGKTDDEFTRSIRRWVSSYEAAAVKCDDVWRQYSERFMGPRSGPAELQQWQLYAASKQLLRACGNWDTDRTRSVRLWVEKFEAAIRNDESGKLIASLFEAARWSGGPETKDPYIFAAIAALVEVRYNALADVMNRTVMSPDLAAARSKHSDELADQIIDAYARAVALCGSDAACAPSKADWMERLSGFYKSRHGGSDAGLRELIEAAARETPRRP